MLLKLWRGSINRNQLKKNDFGRYLVMDVKSVFKFATKVMAKAVEDVVDKTKYSLADVDVVYRQRSTVSSHSSSIKIDNIGEKELLKAACCNLSESFETSPSVDVSFTDAVTGTRQIERLNILLLIVFIASIGLWLIGQCAKENKLHYQFQAITIKHRDVISHIYLE